ncbi:hypothetical protein [Bradyrhizobium sp. RD5-C2]|uniref:hypothetical protein n=1 Tax=Bradyrhizobium sp. RD5-C2 TaxID=244562 RepID=UPI001CC5FDDF|nr:hypothetical protein [Bradyrhizobium sp. RD5-C2]GIQ76206.1 hypothetical protein BraRD5C2_46500 [Bradyrhizobium sp. RD5-C2]
MIKVPDIYEYSGGLRAKAERQQEIASQRAAAEQKAIELQNRLASGLSKEDRDANAARALRGESIPDIEAGLKAAIRDLRALQDAEAIHARQLDDLRLEEGRRLCDDFRPHSEKYSAEIAVALYDALEAWTKLFAIKRGFLNQGLGLYGLCEIDPQELLGVPTDRSSTLADFMRRCVHKGYIKKLPEGLRK